MDFDIENIFNILTAVVFIASAVAALFPTPKEDSKWAKFYKFIDIAALNIGKAKDTGKIIQVVNAVETIKQAVKKKK